MSVGNSSFSRRRLLAGGGSLAALGALAACGATASAPPRRPEAPPRSYTLTPQPTRLDLGGPAVQTWAFGDTLPGPLLRGTAGDRMRVTVASRLPAGTTVHWHGLPVVNAMDGVPDVTQPQIAAGTPFTYEFTLPDPGTYWYHSHVGVQRDRGLYGPLIIDDPHEPGRYDVEWTIVVDDWIDGTGTTPDRVLQRLESGGMMMSGGGMMGKGSPVLGGDAGDVTYPYYLLNGRAPAAPVSFTAKPRQKARIRMINAGGDTSFRVALGGHRLTVTHTDGYPVAPVTVDTLVLGMGERYDVEVTLADGVFPLVAVAEGKTGQALGVVRTGAGAVPPANVRPAELDGRMLDYAGLHAASGAVLPARTPDVTHDLVLGGGMMPYRWTINGRAYPDDQPLPVRQGQYVRLRYRNTTAMYHPVHLHGHTFALRQGNSPTGPRKDTAIVLPGQTIVADFVADNPGQWVTHCHNAYHDAAGMMTVISYQA
ncbi:multicopper oxidase family protein [Amycolatopsis alkalitolerans]|uniref:Multicopper oxidase family protein n=1 Tax=Amycolatopsis alkalitolerans TaxID=2547244 RepID=A0A5C4LUV0_9PSEU|nr:multicopper oxidase family protein [Amycolatopsis alkalitolerans]TNC21552.1 multicopper oxidase family protein [Amycolatopsis alkalitolerans]